MIPVDGNVQQTSICLLPKFRLAVNRVRRQSEGSTSVAGKPMPLVFCTAHSSPKAFMMTVMRPDAAASSSRLGSTTISSPACKTQEYKVRHNLRHNLRHNFRNKLRHKLRHNLRHNLRHKLRHNLRHNPRHNLRRNSWLHLCPCTTQFQKHLSDSGRAHR